jgi:hypothetical protein
MGNNQFRKSLEKICFNEKDQLTEEGTILVICMAFTLLFALSNRKEKKRNEKK